MIRMCRNCKYFALNGGHCIAKVFAEPIDMICNYHEFTRGALEKQARLNKDQETSVPGFLYADTDSVAIKKD